MRITTVEPMKCAALLNITPPSLAHIQELMPTCTTRKDIRNNPVKPITNFFPTADVKNSDHFIWLVFIWAFGHLFALSSIGRSKVAEQVFAKIVWGGQRMIKKFKRPSTQFQFCLTFLSIYVSRAVS